MKSDLDIIQNLIRNEALVTVQKDQYANNFLELKEPPSEKQPEYKIEISKVPNDAIAIKSDAFHPPKEIFKNSKGECRRADFVIIASSEKKNWIIYIEMKHRNPSSESEIIQQLKGAECFIDYCRSIGRVFWQKPKFLDEKNYEQFFISVKNIGINKKPSKEKKSALHNRPENMLKISAPSKKELQFNSLIA